MSALFRRIPTALAGQVPTILVLAALVGLGIWGDRNEWKVGPFRAKAEPERPKEEEKAATDGTIQLPSEESGEKAGLESEPVRAHPMDQVVAAPGVAAFNQNRYAQLSARAEGTVWRIFKGEGDAVQEGEVLALVAAKDAGIARNDFLQGMAQVEIKEKFLRDLRASTGSVPERQIREAEVAVREARLRLLSAEQSLANLGLPIRPKDLTGLSDKQAAKKLKLFGLPANLNAEDVPADLVPVRAPFGGEVIRRHVVMGQGVGPNQAQFIVGDARELWIHLDVRLEDVAQLKVGQAVLFRPDAGGREIRGKLIWISPEVDPQTRTIRVRAEAANPDGRLRPATFGTAQILIKENQPAVAVSDRAVQWDGRTHVVFVKVDKETYQPRLVLPGPKADGLRPLHDPRPFIPVVTAGLLASNPLTAALGAATASDAFRGVHAGERVVTTGSRVLLSEMQKDRISGEE
jgi:multidrug efflux pump subunit AcrA (membrane-fusion protein)